MTNGTVAAMTIADLIHDEPDDGAETSDATRVAANGHAPGVVRGGVDLAKRLVGDRRSNLNTAERTWAHDHPKPPDDGRDRST